MYQRGYVQTMVFDKEDDDVPMCDCIENMPAVSRSDCTQVDVTLTFRLFMKKKSINDLFYLLEVESEKNDLDVQYNSCQGYNYNNPDQSANNDLASYAVRLVDEGNSNTNEAACKESY